MAQVQRGGALTTPAPCSLLGAVPGPVSPSRAPQGRAVGLCTSLVQSLAAGSSPKGAALSILQRQLRGSALSRCPAALSKPSFRGVCRQGARGAGSSKARAACSQQLLCWWGQLAPSTNQYSGSALRLPSLSVCEPQARQQREPVVAETVSLCFANG